ncbi:uncharacterized protein LOC123919931 isoform X1 [Trifolium pratense]|uniref:uncharacterized protein LOC123919931 isoform X1 n=1 Tax=Trifolium pratense TaxID=57577 RepID=UPI001E696BF6|nr:uncharacterized protein LOC123919931 isoform X1 [Trifolium pratense]
MNRMATSTTKLEKWQHRIMPMPMRRLDKEVYMSGQWITTWSIDEEFQVAHQFNGQQFKVDIAKKTCSCNFWELIGIPCRHAVAALGYRKQNPSDFVDHYYTKEKYALCYGFGVSTINGMDMWPEPENAEERPEILPPIYKTGPGRPKKVRIREFDEDGVRKRKRGVKYRCTTCNSFKHNAATCKSKTQDPEAMNRKRKQPRGKDNTNSESKQDNANTEIVEPIATTEVVIDASQSQVEAVIDASQSFFDEIPDEVMATVPEINHDDIPKKAKAVKDNAVKDKPVKDKAKTVKKKTTMVEPEKRRQSERQKANWVKKPTIGPGK